MREVLRSPGQPLENGVRTYFEARFGYDFSRVRIHIDADAAESARAIEAQAYTVGDYVAFAKGRYSPDTGEGRRLMAHELSHVVQQNADGAASGYLQRQPEKTNKPGPEKVPKPRQDVVLLGEGVSGGKELSALLAHGGRVLEVKSLPDAAKALANLNAPIGTLYFVTHSTADGSLKFGTDEGFVKSEAIGKQLKGAVSGDNAPDTVDFRGCSVGSSPTVMEGIRTALGARSVVAGNCYSVIEYTTPIKMGLKGQETEVTRPEQVSKAERPRFLELYRATLAVLVRKSAADCILTKSENDFFAAGGRFVALWFNPIFEKGWLTGKSVCYSQAVRETVDPAHPSSAAQGCRVITVEVKPAESKP
jgi:hypothetical protein